MRINHFIVIIIVTVCCVVVLLSVWKCQIGLAGVAFLFGTRRLFLDYLSSLLSLSLSLLLLLLPFLLSNPASPHPFASSRVVIDTAIRFSCHPRQAEYLNLIKVCMMCPPD